MYGAKKKGGMPKKKGMPKALVGKQNKLPDTIKKAIKAAPETKKGMPEKKKSPNKVIGAVAGMVGKALIGKAVSKAMDKNKSPNTKKHVEMKVKVLKNLWV